MTNHRFTGLFRAPSLMILVLATLTTALLAQNDASPDGDSRAPKNTVETDDDLTSTWPDPAEGYGDDPYGPAGIWELTITGQGQRGTIHLWLSYDPKTGKISKGVPVRAPSKPGKIPSLKDFQTYARIAKHTFDGKTIAWAFKPPYQEKARIKLDWAGWNTMTGEYVIQKYVGIGKPREDDKFYKVTARRWVPRIDRVVTTNVYRDDRNRLVMEIRIIGENFPWQGDLSTKEYPYFIRFADPKITTSYAKGNRTSMTMHLRIPDTVARGDQPFYIFGKKFDGLIYTSENTYLCVP